MHHQLMLDTQILIWQYFFIDCTVAECFLIRQPCGVDGLVQRGETLGHLPL